MHGWNEPINERLEIFGRFLQATEPPHSCGAMSLHALLPA